MDSLKRDLIRTEIDRQRAKRVQLQSSLPAVNRDLFLKLKSEQMEEPGSNKKKKKKKIKTENLLQDDR